MGSTSCPMRGRSTKLANQSNYFLCTAFSDLFGCSDLTPTECDVNLLTSFSIIFEKLTVHSPYFVQPKFNWVWRGVVESKVLNKQETPEVKLIRKSLIIIG